MRWSSASGLSQNTRYVPDATRENIMYVRSIINISLFSDFSFISASLSCPSLRPSPPVPLPPSLSVSPPLSVTLLLSLCVYSPFFSNYSVFFSFWVDWMKPFGATCRSPWMLSSTTTGQTRSPTGKICTCETRCHTRYERGVT